MNYRRRVFFFPTNVSFTIKNAFVSFLHFGENICFDFDKINKQLLKNNGRKMQLYRLLFHMRQFKGKPSEKVTLDVYKMIYSDLNRLDVTDGFISTSSQTFLLSYEVFIVSILGLVCIN